MTDASSAKIASDAEGLVNQLIEFAGQFGWTGEIEEVLDALWLMRLLPPEERYKVAMPPPPPVPPDLLTGSASTERKIPRNQGEPDDADSDADPDPPVNEDSGEVADVFNIVPEPVDSVNDLGVPIYLPAPRQLANQRRFIQLWKPLMLNGPSRIRVIANAEETSRRWAQEGFLEVIEQPAKERQVDLTLILDYSPSMDMWRAAMRELVKIFSGCGGFRRVNVLCLTSKTDQPLGTPEICFVRPGDLNHRTPARTRIRKPSGSSPSLCLILSDCISSIWRSANWIKMIDGWARFEMVAVLQMLPELMWQFTHLERAERTTLSNNFALSPNLNFREIGASAVDEFEAFLAEESGTNQDPLGQAALPATSAFQPTSLISGIQFMGARSCRRRICFRLKAISQVKTTKAMPAIDALNVFGTRASRSARKMAQLLAAAPAISLPLARIVQSIFLPDCDAALTQAELWMSGMLEPITTGPDIDPEQLLYRFRGDIQDHLLDGVEPGLRHQILLETSRYIEEELGRLTGFRAWLLDPEGHEGELKLNAGADPIAQIAANVLRRMGGQFAKLVARQSRRIPAAVDLNDLLLSHVYFGESAHRCCWSSDGSCLAIPNTKGELALRYATGEDHVYEMSGQGINQASWSPDGQSIALACFARVVMIVNQEGKQVQTIEGHNSDVTCVAFSPDGELLASGTSGGTVRIWQRHEARRRTRWTLVESHYQNSIVCDVRWRNSTQILVGYRQQALLLSVDDAGLSVVRKFDASGVTAIAIIVGKTKWSQDRDLIAVGLKTGEIQLIDVDSGDKVHELFLHRGQVTSLDISSDGRLLASKANDGSIKVVRLDTGHIVGQLETTSSRLPYGTVAFRPGTNELAAAISDEQRLHVFNLQRLAYPKQSGVLRIRIVGSAPDQKRTKSRAHDSEFTGFCRELGREIARRGHILVISSGEPQTADHAACLGYFEDPRGQEVVLARPGRTAIERYFHSLNESRHNLNNRWSVDQIADILYPAFTRSSAKQFGKDVSDIAPKASRSNFRRRTLEGIVAASHSNNTLQDLLKTVADMFPGNSAFSNLARNNRNGGCDFTIQRIDEETWNKVAIAKIFDNVDVLIVIGGGSRTLETFEIGRTFEIPSIPIPMFGGAAKDIFETPSNFSREHERLGEIVEEPNAERHYSAIIDLLEQSNIRRSRMALGRRNVCHLKIHYNNQEPLEAVGIAISSRQVLTVAHTDVHAVSGPATTVELTFGRFNTVFAHKILPVRSASDSIARLCVLLADDPLERSSSITFHQSLNDRELTDRSVQVFSTTDSRQISRQGGIVYAVSKDWFEVWTQTPLRAGFIGAPVLVPQRGTDGKLVGLITGEISEGNRYEAMRITDELADILERQREEFENGAMRSSATNVAPPAAVLNDAEAIQFVVVPPGSFVRGTPRGGLDDERPAKKIALTRGFVISSVPITQEQFRAVTGDNPSYHKGPGGLPVEQVTWFDAITFCNLLSEQQGIPPYYAIDHSIITIRDENGDGFRLPTEAEWEYVCRAGTQTKYFFGDTADLLSRYAWYNANASQPQPVGKKQPNPFGVYDVLGNVWEWCWDIYLGKEYERSPITDPHGPETGVYRCMRGGSWDLDAESARPGYRGWDDPRKRSRNVGFRIARNRTVTSPQQT